MGVKKGSKKSIIDYNKIKLFKSLKDQGLTIREIVEQTGSSSVTVLKYLKEEIKPDAIEEMQKQINQLKDQINFIMKQLEPARQDHQPIKKNDVLKQDIKQNKTELGAGKVFFTTSKIIMLVKTAKGDQPCNDTIQRVMKAWRYNNPDFDGKKGYPLDALLINLKAWNQKSKDRDKLDFSELETLKDER